MTILQNLSVRGACGKGECSHSKIRETQKQIWNNNVNSITIRGLEIQKDSRRVFVNGKEVNLAQKEFDVLLFLAQNPNRVFQGKRFLTEYGEWMLWEMRQQ